jgi:uncharacterized protein GlcG (DUF336 family)
MTLATADAIIDAILTQAEQRKAPPLTVSVVDTAGSIVSLKRQDGAPLMRPDIATGKARTCIFFGKSSRAYGKLTEDRPHFGRALSDLASTAFVPAAGGVPIKDSGGALIGAVGVSGDTSDNDEAMAAAALAGLGLAAVLD